jgi:hypothetical protein
LKKDSVLEKLEGEWYYYFYGSMYYNNDFRLWDITIKIYGNKVDYLLNKKLLLTGYINTHYNKHQVIIQLNSLMSSNLTLITICKKSIYKNIFKVSMLDKQFGTKYDMVSFGIFSKIKLDETLVKKALGNVNEVMLRESIELEQRINELYIESQF